MIFAVFDPLPLTVCINCMFSFILAVLLPDLSRLLITSINTTFFDFSRWRPSAILDFQEFKIFTAGVVRRANMRHHAKCADRSNH